MPSLLYVYRGSGISPNDKCLIHKQAKQKSLVPVNTIRVLTISMKDFKLIMKHKASLYSYDDDDDVIQEPYGMSIRAN